VPSPERFTTYTLELAGNPFFQVNKGVLVGLMVQSANYWVASHDRNPTERDITKCFWHSVIYEVAHLVGGWEHMAEVTKKTLEFDYETETHSPPSLPLICDRCDQKCQERSLIGGLSICPRCRLEVELQPCV
jgi:hypothetical protein